MNRTIEPVQTIVSFMGWNNMPAAVALDAVRTIIRNTICRVMDCCGEPDRETLFQEELCCLRDLIDNGHTDQETVWAGLFTEDYETLNDVEMQKLAISLRWEIEDLMMHGVFFKDARREYDI